MTTFRVSNRTTTGFASLRCHPITAQLDFNVSPGIGKFENVGDNLLLVEEIQDGYRVRAIQSAFEFGDRPKYPIPDFGDPEPQFSVSWAAEEEQWYRFDARINSVSSTVQEALVDDIIAPLESDHGFRFGTQSFAPKSTHGRVQNSLGRTRVNHELGDVMINWEFDRNTHRSTSSGRCQRRRKRGLGRRGCVDRALQHGRRWLDWGGADFNLDGRTDFADFQILSKNYRLSPRYHTRT